MQSQQQISRKVKKKRSNFRPYKTRKHRQVFDISKVRLAGGRITRPFIIETETSSYPLSITSSSSQSKVSSIIPAEEVPTPRSFAASSSGTSQSPGNFSVPSTFRAHSDATPRPPVTPITPITPITPVTPITRAISISPITSKPMITPISSNYSSAIRTPGSSICPTSAGSSASSHHAIPSYDQFSRQLKEEPNENRTRRGRVTAFSTSDISTPGASTPQATSKRVSFSPSTPGLSSPLYMNNLRGIPIPVGGLSVNSSNTGSSISGGHGHHSTLSTINSKQTASGSFYS